MDKIELKDCIKKKERKADQESSYSYNKYYGVWDDDDDDEYNAYWSRFGIIY